MSSITNILSLGAGDPAPPDYSSSASKNEAKRQALIDRGMQRINAVYQGGTFPTYNKASGVYDPKGSYFELNKKGSYVPYTAPKRYSTPGWNNPLEADNGPSPDPTANLVNSLGEMFFGGSTEPKPWNLMKKGKLYQQGESQSYQGFTPAFFQQRQQDYIDYAMPQLGEQYRNTANLMKYGLSNRGLAGSSIAQKSTSDLARSTGQAQQTIVDTARGQAQSLRDRIEAARQGDINMLYQTADPARAQQQATATASSFQSPSSFVPLANMFSNLANQYYLGQVLNTYRQPGTTTAPAYNASPYYSNNAGALPPVEGNQ